MVKVGPTSPKAKAFQRKNIQSHTVLEDTYFMVGSKEETAGESEEGKGKNNVGPDTIRGGKFLG